MIQLNINTDSAVKFTNALEKLHRSALPSAIRGALNDAAFDVKTNTMPHHSAIEFKNRVPNFFKANSKVEKAMGFDVNTMKATVGFVEGALRGGNNFAVRDLNEQESGGTIDKKSFIPLDPARTGKSSDKPVRPNARLKSIGKIVNARNQKGASKSSKFINAVLRAGVGGFVLGSTKKGENILWRVDGLSSNVKTKKFTPKLTALYDWKQGRSVHVQGRSFMKKASLESSKKIEGYYIKQALRQIQKFK